MITALYNDKEKTTAKKLANQIILEAIESAFYWDEKLTVATHLMSDDEKQAVHEAVSKQLEKIQKQLSK